MSKLISLAAYHIKVRNKTEREFEVLSNFGAGEDLLVFLRAVFAELQKGIIDHSKAGQVLSVLQIEESERTLSGIIESGEYGYDTNLYDTQAKKIAYNRKQNEADMWPFYFFIQVPAGADEGLLILQRTGNFGIRKVLLDVVGGRFLDEYPDLRLHLLPSVEAGEVEKFVKGDIKKLSLIRMNPPTDKADAYESGHQEIRGHMELVIRAKRGTPLAMRAFLREVFGNHSFSGRYALGEDQFFEYDDVKVTTKVGSSRRTILASNPARIRSYYDVTDEVVIGPGGHPTYASLHEQALKHAAIINNEVYGEEAQVR